MPSRKVCTLETLSLALGLTLVHLIDVKVMDLLIAVAKNHCGPDQAFAPPTLQET